jgi:NAD(P)-dependent dehydrogenase (short-subunit alcohol dehydrogenase family)
VTFEIDLGGRAALVTGAGQGVGRGISLAFARAGAKVFVNDYLFERAAAVVAEIHATGGTAEALPFDVSSYEAVSEAVQVAGPIDILVNNAGNAGPEGYTIAPFMKTVPADWDRYFAVNLYGVMNCTHAVLPGMAERRDGRIITIVSEAGRTGEASLAAYCAAKAGAAGFMRSIAKDVGRYLITANNVALGTIDTFGIEDASHASPEATEAFAQRIRPYLIRRLGQPDDVAGIVTFLASPLAAWITGQTYPVNGGYVLNQ